MSVYVEVLETGLTLGSGVRSAGDLVKMDDSFEPQSKSAQVKRWGAPKYRVISEKDFVERGGDIEGVSGTILVGPGEIPPESPGGEDFVPSEPASEFADLEGKTVDETLDAVASFDDATTQRFIAFEKENDNRKGVLEPLGAWSE